MMYSHQTVKKTDCVHPVGAEVTRIPCDDIETPGNDIEHNSNCWTSISKAPRWKSWVCFCFLLNIFLVSRYVMSRYVETAGFISEYFFVVFALFSGVLFFVPKCHNSKHNKNDSILKFSAQTEAPAKSGRVFYLDTIKTYLTAVVITVHVMCVFVGFGMWGHTFAIEKWFQPFADFYLNCYQSFFMCMFFFISGYFTPSSLDRQISRSNGTMGYWAFLRNKFKRLGIPALVTLFVLEPLRYLISQLATGAPLTYQPTLGVCWYLCWLLIFTVCYAFIGGDPVVGNRPQFMWMFIVCIVLFPVQQLVSEITKGIFLAMPSGHGSLPYDILFFTCGVLAKRGGWLNTDNPLSKASLVAAGVLGLLSSIYYFVSAWATVNCTWPLLRYDDGSCNATMTGAPATDTSELVFGKTLFYLVGGIAVISFSYLHVGLSQRCCNREPSKIGAALNRSAYAAYVLHPLVVTSVGVLWQYILVNIGTEVEFWSDSHTGNFTFSDYVSNLSSQFIVETDMSPAMYWAGFAFVLVVTQMIVWPLSICVKQIPGVKNIF